MSRALIMEPLGLLLRADATREVANAGLDLENKNAFAQYMTPASVAAFMTSLFPPIKARKVSLLDPGAGVGILTSAFIEHVCKSSAVTEIDIDAYEVDAAMHGFLKENLKQCREAASNHEREVTWRVLGDDFISTATSLLTNSSGLWPEEFKRFSHCIMNPPYKKISSRSKHRLELRLVGIETVNLYTAFMALALLLLEDGGQLVAIVPRSFCNGPYYRPFRAFLLEHAALQRIHLFEARDRAFKHDKVLQENIIIRLEKGAVQGRVQVSISTDDSFSDISVTDHKFYQVVREKDRELIIHIPTSGEADPLSGSSVVCHSLADIGLRVSTGPVVDFRLRRHLRHMPTEDTVPLLYPCHFKGKSVNWPIEGGKKPNAIALNMETQRWLYPCGYYTVVRRFSSKEEKRRIVAGMIDPKSLGEVEFVGIENHLNVFHENKKPLSIFLALGLSVFLNSSLVDKSFRRFSGHTQVNATDLKFMKYPSRKTLVELGDWAKRQNSLTPELIDLKMLEIIK